MEEEEYSAYETITLEKTASNLSTISMVRIISCTSANEEEIHRRINEKQLHFTDVFREVQRMVASTAEKLDADEDVAYVLLQKHKWQEDNCILNALNQGYEFTEMLKKVRNAGLAKQLLHGKCPVCEEEDYLMRSYCAHFCCRGCWLAVLQQAIDNRRPSVGCINPQCRLPLFHSFILDLQQDPRPYQRCLSQSYVASSKSMRFCPAADCEFCYQDLSQSAKNVVCRCGKRFCFKCGNEPHQPCSCKDSERWFSLTKNELTNEQWIKKNTKICPSCKSSVERAFGCNQIMCTCGNRFCYLCGSKWDELHTNHECPFKEKVAKESAPVEQRSHASEQARLTSIQYNRYLYHSSIQRKILDQLRSIGELRNDLSAKLYVPDSETQFMQTAFEKQLECRSTVKWAQIFQFLHRDSQTYDLRQFGLAELKQGIDNCTTELIEFVRRARQLATERSTFLQVGSSPALLKQFHQKREIILKLVSQNESSVCRLVESLEK